MQTENIFSTRNIDDLRTGQRNKTLDKLKRDLARRGAGPLNIPAGVDARDLPVEDIIGFTLLNNFYYLHKEDILKFNKLGKEKGFKKASRSRVGRQLKKAHRNFKKNQRENARSGMSKKILDLIASMEE